MTARAWRRIVDAIADEVDAIVTVTGSGHLRLTHPSGWFVTAAKSPGDHRSEQNLWRDIRHARRGQPRGRGVAVG